MYGYLAVELCSAGTQNEDTGEEGEDKNGSQAEDGTDGMSDGSGVDETGSPRRGKGRKGRSIGGRKNQDGQDLEGSEEEHSGTQIEDNWEAENTEDRLGGVHSQKQKKKHYSVTTSH